MTEEKMPEHVAVIMDGNRRWATDKGMEPWKGHKKGKEVAEDMMNYFLDGGVKEISIYILSNDNLIERKENNIEKLLDIEHEGFKDLLNDEKLENYEINVRFVGKWWEIDRPSLKETIKSLIDETKKYGKRTINIVFNYVTMFMPGDEGYKRQLKQEQELSEIDLLVRTGNRKRISSFLPTKIGYCEIYFEDDMFPDTTQENWEKWLKWFSERERNFGE